MPAAERLEEIRSGIAAASKVAGRDPSAVTLIAVSKTRGVAEIEALATAGQRDFGESRVQEALDKWPDLLAANSGLRLHCIGRLQSNKAADAVAMFDCIHSLDRPSLVTALARAFGKAARRVPCFVQVDIGEEPQKGGCAISGVPALLDQARAADIPVIGLMCVPPLGIEPAPFFGLLDKLARDNGLPGRSMGMSGDFDTAIMLGATHVRIGTALFGDRAA